MGQQESRIGKIARLQGLEPGAAERRIETLRRNKKRTRGISQPRVFDIVGERAPLLPTSLQQNDTNNLAALTEVAKMHTESSRKQLAQGRQVLLEIQSAGTKTKVPQEQLKMFTVTGAIGIGLFLGLGRALQIGGPLGTLIAYFVVGLVACAVQYALAEVSALYPVHETYITHAEMLIDDSLGFALEWNSVYGHMISVPAAITAILVLIQAFTTNYKSLFVTLMVIATAFFASLRVDRYNSTTVSYFNKISLVIGITILAITIDLGCIPGIKPYGFRYWHHPGPFVDYLISGFWGKFIGFWAVMPIAIYSFAGIEDFATAGVEAGHPRQNIPKACRKIFFRLVCLILVPVFSIGILVPSSDPDLQDIRARSPFVIVTDRLGYSFVSSVMTLMIIVAAWSSATTSMFNGLRVLDGLITRGYSSQELSLTISWAGVFCQIVVAAFSYIALFIGPLAAFYLFVNLVAAETVISWIVILLNHIRLRQACIEQRIDRENLPWHYWWTGYSTYLALVPCILFLLTGGFTVFIKDQWNTGTFLAAYLDIPLLLILYCGRRYMEKTTLVPLDEVPIREILEDIEKHPEDSLPVETKWEKINPFWG